jgi:hypothetical protein
VAERQADGERLAIRLEYRFDHLFLDGESGSHASDLLFAPTKGAARSLIREGIPQKKIRWVGHVMYDAALYYGANAERAKSVLLRLALVGKDLYSGNSASS